MHRPQEAYTPKALPSYPAPVGPSYAPSSIPFDGTTTARSDYTAKPLERHAPAPTGADYASRPRIPFDGKSTAQVRGRDCTALRWRRASKWVDSPCM